MTDLRHKILVVQPDPELLELLVASLTSRFDAHLTCASDVSSCVAADMAEPHDLVIAEMNLADGTGLELAEQLMMFSAKPIVLLAAEPSYADAVAAMRLGVCDMFRKPFAVEGLLDAVQHALYQHRLKRCHAVRYQRMRRLVRRVICERRDIRRRIELVCRDLVGAQRRLVQRVLSLEGAKPEPSA